MNSAVALLPWRAFGAVESAERIIDASDRIGHAEFMIGDALIMISDEHPEIDVLGPQSLGGSTSALVLTVEDADAAFEQAVAAGAAVVRPLKNEPYGRTGKLVLAHHRFRCTPGSGVRRGAFRSPPTRPAAARDTARTSPAITHGGPKSFAPGLAPSPQLAGGSPCHYRRKPS